MFVTTFQTFSVPHLVWTTKEPELLFRCLILRWVKYLKPRESSTLTKCSRSCRERLMDNRRASMMMNYFRIHLKAAINKVGWRSWLREANKSKQFNPHLKAKQRPRIQERPHRWAHQNQVSIQVSSAPPIILLTWLACTQWAIEGLQVRKNNRRKFRAETLCLAKCREPVRLLIARKLVLKRREGKLSIYLPRSHPRSKNSSRSTATRLCLILVNRRAQKPQSKFQVKQGPNLERKPSKRQQPKWKRFSRGDPFSLNIQMTVRPRSLLSLEGTSLARWGNVADRRKSLPNRSWTSPKLNCSSLYVHYCQWPYQTNVSAIGPSASNFTVNASPKEAFVVLSVAAPIASTKREKKTR